MKPFDIRDQTSSEFFELWVFSPDVVYEGEARYPFEADPRSAVSAELLPAIMASFFWEQCTHRYILASASRGL
jgi:hypothetical protein